MRQIYTFFFYLALPLILLRLYWRGRKIPGCRLRWSERLGFYSTPVFQRPIWFHCVSVGEAEAAFPLIRLMQSEHPEQNFLVTTMTVTGSERVRAVLGDRVDHVYLPYDVPSILNRFFDHFHPKLAIFLEKELWPNLYAVCAERRTPLFIINGRLSQHAAQPYKWIAALMLPALHSVARIAVQTEEDRQHFIDIGAESSQVQVFGNTKFDQALSDSTILAGRDLRLRVFGQRFVWILASTHQGEEVELIKGYQQLKACLPQLLLVIAPRHPERFQLVKQLCLDAGLSVVMRSENGLVDKTTDVYVADTMGELKLLYVAADVAFVGGSLVPVGGHNVLEPALAGVPVIFGVHMFNFKEIADRILMEEAAIQAHSPEDIVEAVLKIHTDSDFRNKLIARAKAFVLRNQGATQRISDMLSSYL